MRAFLFFLNENTLQAADASSACMDVWPFRIEFRGREYTIIEERCNVFWDEIRDGSGATTGYQYTYVEPDTFFHVHLWSAQNVRVDHDRKTVDVHLVESCQRNLECVQGFGCAMYAIPGDPPEEVLMTLHYSENNIAFPVVNSPVRVLEVRDLEPFVPTFLPRDVRSLRDLFGDHHWAASRQRGPVHWLKKRITARRTRGKR